MYIREINDKYGEIIKIKEIISCYINIINVINTYFHHISYLIYNNKQYNIRHIIPYIIQYTTTVRILLTTPIRCHSLIYYNKTRIPICTDIRIITHPIYNRIYIGDVTILHHTIHVYTIFHALNLILQEN